MLHAAIEEAHELSDRVLEATAQIQQLELMYTVDPAVEPRSSPGSRGTCPSSEALEAHEGLARAWRLIMFVREMGLQWGASEAAAQRALDHARMAGDRMMVARAIPSLGYCALSGPTPVLDAIGAAERSSTRSTGTGSPRRSSSRRSHISRRCAATSRSPERCTGRAGRRWRSSDGRSWRRRRRSTPVRWRCSTATSRRRSGNCASDYESLERMGETNYISTTAALLSEVLYRQERPRRCRGAHQISEELAAQDDVTSQFRWRTVRAKVLAARGGLQMRASPARRSH